MTELQRIAIEGLKRNKDLYGKPFCPCLNPSLFTQDNSEDYVCKCKVYRETNECQCGLYV